MLGQSPSPCLYTHSSVEKLDLVDANDTVSALVAALAKEFPSRNEIPR